MRAAVLRLRDVVKASWPFGLAPADPEELNRPPHEPVVNGKLVTIEVVRVNGEKLPRRSLERAIEEFSAYVAGEVRTVEGDPVKLQADADGLLTQAQLDCLVAQRRHRGPSDIAILLVRGLSDHHRGHSFCRDEPDGSHVVVLQTRPPVSLTCAGLGTMRKLASVGAWNLLKALLSRERYWLLVVEHELLHTLGLPYGCSHTSPSASYFHCTNPECILYGGPIARGVLTGILRLGPPDDLCPVCKKEIRRAHEAAGGELIDPDEPYDDLKRLNALVQRNPNRSLAYAYRAIGHWKRGNRDQAITDLTKAIELGPGSKTLACYHNRGVMLIRVGEFRRAISDLERCVELQPDGIANLSALAWVLATCPADGVRDGSRAVELARRACELTNWKDAGMLDTLAAACAESGQFDRATEWQRKAISLAGEEETKEYRERLDLYGARKPYRDPR